ncbi:uncharacterized protein TNCV_4836301 [Trichonephila clavipes]|nr:uncharacterized protein TNCV_4836301 [Trichonephila clavipes]
MKSKKKKKKRQLKTVISCDICFEPFFDILEVVAVAEWYRYRTVACLVTSSSPVPLKTHCVGQRCTLNLSRAETSSRWCGVVVRRGLQGLSPMDFRSRGMSKLMVGVFESRVQLLVSRKTCRVEWLMHFKSVESSNVLVGVVFRREGVPAQVSSTSLDHGSKLRGPSPKALV